MIWINILLLTQIYVLDLHCVDVFLCRVSVIAGLTSSVVKDPSQYEAFFPFGSGARVCIGQKLGIRGISSLFAALVGHYEVFTYISFFFVLLFQQ